MHVNDELFSILDELVLVISPHENFITHVHVWTPKHDSTYIKGNHIQIYFINKISNDSKSNFTLFFYLQLCILMYPTQWMWVWMIMNF